MFGILCLVVFRLVTYVILFGVNFKPLFSKTISLTSDLPEDKGTPKHRALDPQTRELPVHCCSMSPEVVRAEVEMLKTDFNDRIKQVLFNSMLCAYYMGLVPLLFAQVHVSTFLVYTHTTLFEWFWDFFSSPSMLVS